MMNDINERLAILETQQKTTNIMLAEIKRMLDDEKKVSLTKEDFKPYQRMIYGIYGLLAAMILFIIDKVLV